MKGRDDGVEGKERGDGRRWSDRRGYSEMKHRWIISEKREIPGFEVM